MISIILTLAIILTLSVTSCAQDREVPTITNTIASARPVADTAVVYFTSDISPEGLVRIYEALGVKAAGRVGVKISTGEKTGQNYLKPDLIADLVHHVNGTIVECNTAFGGSRGTTEKHRETIHAHGFDAIAPVDILDEEGEIKLPVRDTRHIKYDLVGSHIVNYDFIINLAHFKGHAMGGFGGVLKNQSVGFASSKGKLYIHSAGHTKTIAAFLGRQDPFLESMAASAQAIADYFGDRIVYINVMNNISVDCDCDAHPADPGMKDVGILASLDPVALDKACVDIIFHYPSKEGDDAQPIIDRINKKHGIHTIDIAEQLGMGTQKYKIVKLSN